MIALVNRAVTIAVAKFSIACIGWMAFRAVNCTPCRPVWLRHYVEANACVLGAVGLWCSASGSVEQQRDSADPGIVTRAELGDLL
jgi:hypothetical protein